MIVSHVLWMWLYSITTQQRLLLATKRSSTFKWWNTCHVSNFTRNLLSAKSRWTNLKPFPKMQWPLCPSQGRVPQPPTGSGRSDMIKSAFAALNRSGSGHLSAAEMKPFAEKTGALVMWILRHICTIPCPVLDIIVIGWHLYASLWMLEVMESKNVQKKYWWTCESLAA